MSTDFKREVAAYQAKKGRFDIITVPPMQFLMIDGAGDPNTSPIYAASVETLYPVAYTLKFFSKRELGRDYAVMPLEGLWWADDMAAYTVGDKSAWQWRLMIMVPDWIEREHFEAATAQVAAKARSAKTAKVSKTSSSKSGGQATAEASGTAPRLDDLRLETYDEGLSVQTLHVGPFSDEGPVLEEMHERFIPSNGLTMTGEHHEIYLSDIRRAAPEKWRTILRQPVGRAG
ncbi:MAG TPA: GyrI-like domain-containing protein [Tessaracoccus flavescens]|uniref:GyrI-like domain-containing protein n=1 Tax=Tessaracoccus flavescens TaxID=399497 RepID=A0A921ENR2_9ACTN|nr:GyrI-like domain-containing protein [Tessaracoccus flavescens]